MTASDSGDGPISRLGLEWFLRGVYWLGQTAAVAVLLYVGFAIVGVGTDWHPLAVLGAGAVLAGPFLMLRQVHLLVDSRLDGE